MTKIMIVDDEPDLREMINLMLHKEGFVTVTAENGDDFLKKIDDFTPDLVTLDVMMPGLTTREILEQLKAKKTKPKIILLSVVRYSDEEKRKLFQLGIVDYITKPFEFPDLINTIHQHILRSPAI
ncbi:MAG TPA: two-component system response regulator [Thermoplasmata archaeon]|nr:MAG TPA: two-component system response regulator [Thermoplasmata archaeon]